MRINDLRNGVMPNKSPDADLPDLDLPDLDLTGSCLDLIQAQHVMTLATPSVKSAWAAPVYYVFRDKQFFFFSSLDSQHIKDALAPNAVCAAAIFEDQPQFDESKGVQMSGKIELVKKTVSAIEIAAFYIKRFKIRATSLNSLKFIESTYHARLFSFVADSVFYMDNSKGFGRRQTIKI